MIKKSEFKVLNKKLEKAIRLSKTFEDSFYIIDLELLERDLNHFRKSFSSVDNIISYSYKTNYLKCIVQYLNNRKVRSELVSPFEVDLSRSYLVDADQIIYNGPLKDDASLLYVLSGDGLVHADSLDDLIKISNVIEKSKLSKKRLKIGIRLSFDENDLKSRFGIDFNLDRFSQVLQILKKLDVTFPYSFHFHYPSRDFTSFKKRIDKIISLLKIVFNEYGKLPNYVDIGGGLPSNMPESVVKSLQSNDFLPLKIYGNYLDKSINSAGLPKFKVIFEPGTALVANCMHIVGNIKSINFKSGTTYLNTDLSRNLLGGLTNVINYPLTFIPITDNENSIKLKTEYKLAGYTCVENDIIGNIKINIKPKINDKIVLSNVGSYSNVFKSPFIRPDIAVYSWDGVSLNCIRRKQDVHDIINLDLA